MAVVNVPLIVLVEIFPATVRFCNPPRFVIFAVTALKLFAVTLPDTVRFVKVPRVVMFG